MTVREFIELLSKNPDLIIGYFTLIPLIALLMWWVAGKDGHLSPWKYVYSLLIYAVCVPGITAVAFNIYVFVFERRSIFDSDLFVQVIPVMSMFATLWLIRRNVTFNHIPGFEKISQLITIISAALLLMWLGDKVRIYSFTYVPLWQMILIFGGLILMIRYAWQRIL